MGLLRSKRRNYKEAKGAALNGRDALETQLTNRDATGGCESEKNRNPKGGYGHETWGKGNVATVLRL